MQQINKDGQSITSKLKNILQTNSSIVLIFYNLPTVLIFYNLPIVLQLTYSITTYL